MRRRLLVAVCLAFSFAASGYSKDRGYIEYTFNITGARTLKTRVRAPLTCHVLTQFALRDEHGRLFGFQFDGDTPCGDQPWPNERLSYDNNALTEVYIGVAGDENAPGAAKGKFANNEKARTTIQLRADATGTITFENLQNVREEFVSGTIEFRCVK
jgi:hypothetical protein